MRRVVHKARKYLIPHEHNDYRPYMLRAVGIAAVIFFALSAIVASRVQVLIFKSIDQAASVLPAVLVDMANEDRTANHLPALSVSPKLIAAARVKANDMVKKGYFAHNSPEGISPWFWIMSEGYDFAYAGENLAVNFDDSSVVNTAWMNSPSHRANILSANFTEVGIAIAEGTYDGKPSTFVVQMFGAPAAPKATVVSTAKPIKSSVKVIREPKLEPVSTSQVLGQSAEQNFVAVKNIEATPLLSTTTPAGQAGRLSIASPIAKYSSSPTKVLALIYFGIGLLLAVVFFAVLFIKHDNKNKHVAFILALVVVLFCAYYVYQFALLSQIQIR